MLKKSGRFPAIKGPVVMVVMDGTGVNENPLGHAVYHANMPVLDRLHERYPHTVLTASTRL